MARLLLTLGVLTFVACAKFPGAENDACNEQRVCLPGLFCAQDTCLSLAAARTRLCADKECGAIQDVDCGQCSGLLVCEEHTCAEACAGKMCGTHAGHDCGTCTGATEVCQRDFTCKDVCVENECGSVEGVECGGCPADAVCRAHQCCLDGCGFSLVPAGSFVMGSPADEPQRRHDEELHPVELTRSFWLKSTTVTLHEWRSILGTGPVSPDTATCENCPVRVTWVSGVEYMNALSILDGFEPCYASDADFYNVQNVYDCVGYRYPTEAEWEYATRATSTTAFFNGPSTDNGTGCFDPTLEPIGWYCGNAASGPKEVGQKLANPWGLFDVHGNEWEWTNDLYSSDFYGSPPRDPNGASGGGLRVFRGGNWAGGTGDCRAARRATGPWSSRSGGAPTAIRPARTEHP